LLSEIDRLNPDFASARAKWAGAAQFEDMLEKSNRFMTISGAEFENLMKDLPKIDREAVRIGAIQAIEDKIERGQWTQNVAKFFQTPAMERKMRLLFDTKEGFSAFKNKLKASAAKQATFDAVRGQSATARRTAAASESNSWVDKLTAAADSLSSPAQAVRRGVGLLGRVKPGMSEKARTATAELLLEQDPIQRLANMRYTSGLLTAPPPPPGIPLAPSAVGGLLGTGAAVSTFE
jgi:hypothetical protein